MTPQQTSDLLEIQQLIYRYAWLIDTRDFDGLDTVFAPGAEVHYNVFGGVKQTWPEIESFLRMGLSLHRVTQHQMSNPMVDLDGDRATARTYGNLVAGTQPENAGQVMSFFGRQPGVRTIRIEIRDEKARQHPRRL